MLRSRRCWWQNLVAIGGPEGGEPVQGSLFFFLLEGWFDTSGGRFGGFHAGSGGSATGSRILGLRASIYGAVVARV
ncbi:hypothetical protein RchiOBHm_Chr6g0258161 [Rosa chinensis]|uniref:Uncharacterized protein n=1 Tax=Rosa chinensis TaxID=74649 RepID=A0A2P6PMI8_ROSCH|nr:hypothetical protein RchiOBHm_Chr6g0258161 [Rosa chinensis]